MSERAPTGAGEDWGSRLHELIEILCEDWHLSRDDERTAGGAWGVVVYCRTENGREAVLKVCAHEQRLATETRAMLAWVGGPQPASSLTARGALLLQRARPGTPSRLAPSRLAMLFDALHRPANATGLGLGDWRASINAAVLHAPSPQAVGRDLPREGNGRPLHTLHGDLQPANILEHRGATAVIDPVGIAGPREMDVANAALNDNWGEQPAPSWPSRGSSARQLFARPGIWRASTRRSHHQRASSAATEKRPRIDPRSRRLTNSIRWCGGGGLFPLGDPWSRRDDRDPRLPVGATRSRQPGRFGSQHNVCGRQGER